MTARRASPSHRRTSPLAHLGRMAALCVTGSGLALVLSGAGTSGAMSSHTSKNVVVSALKTAKFGTILVSEKTLYTLKPSSVPCDVACTKVWPELLLPKGATKAIAGAGVSASKLGTVSRPGGVLQVTYGGKPLYWFAFDNGPGQVKGNVTDMWGTWTDVAASKPSGSVHTTTTTSPGGGGVGF